MITDSRIECHCCGKKRLVNFAHCLREGWPMCCGQTMLLTRTATDIGLAVGEAIGEGLAGVRHRLQLPGDSN